MEHQASVLGVGRGTREVQAHTPVCWREVSTGCMLEFPNAPLKLPLLARGREGAGAINPPCNLIT